jgi:hypothetical protein
MTLGEAFDLIGIMVGLAIFPGIPILILASFGLYWLLAWLNLGGATRFRRRDRPGDE